MFTTLLTQPLYNGLVFIMDTSPLFDAGMAVLLLTVIIKLILFPLSKKAVITQLRMKQIAPELEKVKEEYKDDKQVQAQKTLELYKENGIRPFASILLIFIQLPIIFALYKVFLQSGLPEINTELLYSFVPTPENVNVMFLGLIDITSKSWILAICAAVTNFFQIRYSMPAYTPKEGAERTLKDDFAKSMQLQMKYVFPVVVLFIAYSISGAIAIYWTTSNLFMIGQELVLRKHKRKHEQGQD